MEDPTFAITDCNRLNTHFLNSGIFDSVVLNVFRAKHVVGIEPTFHEVVQ